MTHDELLALMGILSWFAFMATYGLYCLRAANREWEKGDEQLYYEVYGPAGKPKPVTAEPEFPKRSVE